MNTNLTSVFAQKLFHSPDMLNGDLDAELVEQIRRFAKGDLRDNDAAIIAELIQEDADVAACYQSCRESFGVAPQEQPSRIKCPTHVSFFDQLSEKVSDIMESFQSLIAPRQTVLSCSTDAVPIYGKAGPNDEIMFTMRPTSTGQTEISLTTKIAAWKDLTVSLGEHQPQEILLEQVGDRWAGSLEFPLSFTVLGRQRPNIQVQNT